MRVRFRAVVENSNLRESRHQFDQMYPTPVVALSNRPIKYNVYVNLS
jgi:hypothetical protein